MTYRRQYTGYAPFIHYLLRISLPFRVRRSEYCSPLCSINTTLPFLNKELLSIRMLGSEMPGMGELFMIVCAKFMVFIVSKN